MIKKKFMRLLDDLVLPVPLHRTLGNTFSEPHTVRRQALRQERRPSGTRWPDNNRDSPRIICTDELIGGVMTLWNCFSASVRLSAHLHFYESICPYKST